MIGRTLALELPVTAGGIGSCELKCPEILLREKVSTGEYHGHECGVYLTDPPHTVLVETEGQIVLCQLVDLAAAILVVLYPGEPAGGKGRNQKRHRAAAWFGRTLRRAGGNK